MLQITGFHSLFPLHCYRHLNLCGCNGSVGNWHLASVQSKIKLYSIEPK